MPKSLLTLLIYKLLEIEIDDLKKVNTFKELQLSELIEEKNSIYEENEALRDKYNKHARNEEEGEKNQQISSSLADELNLCDVAHSDIEKFECNFCGEKFVEKSHAKNHIKSVHVKEEELKLMELEKRVSSQVLVLTNSINKIMLRELSQKDKPCICQRGRSRFFCKINHRKHNWVKSDSQDIIEKLKDIKNSVDEKEGESREVEDVSYSEQTGGVS